MFFTIANALLIYLPAYIANMMPILFDKASLLPSLAVPLDRGKKLGKYDLFGSHKTIRGIISGIIGGALTGLIQGIFLSNKTIPGISWFLLWGTLLGLGALTGDLIKSFFKRRLAIKDGSMFIPWDQLDFILGALIFGSILETPQPNTILVLLIITPLLHISANIIAYFLHWKKVWW